MEGHTDHSDSDSGESWTLLDHEVVMGEECHKTTESKSFVVDSSDKDDDTDGISIISDSEAESPTSLVMHSLEDQTVKEEIPVYSAQDIDIETNIQNVDEDTEPLVEDNTTGDNIKHKIYVHRRNNRLSTVLNIMMLVSVMTAAGVAIGHMWGVKNDCMSHTTPSFNKILSDLYKLQAENTHYRNKLKELSLIIEDNLHTQCEKESNATLNMDETVKCRQQKIHEIQKYLKTNAESKRIKRTPIPYSQKDESKLRNIKEKNISKLKAVGDQKFDVKMDPKDQTLNEKLQQQEAYEQIVEAELREETNLAERRVSYADSLKSTNFIKEDTNDNIFRNKEKKMKQRKKHKDLYNLSEMSISEEDFVKDGRYSTPKLKLELKKHDRQRFYKNNKRRNKHEDWELKEGLLKYYDDLSVKLLKSRTNQFDTRYNKIHKKMETDQGKVNPYNDYNRKGEIESDVNLNWFDNRAQLRKEARKKQELQLNESNPAEWHFKRMNRREQCRAKENSIYKRRGFKSKP